MEAFVRLELGRTALSCVSQIQIRVGFALVSHFACLAGFTARRNMRRPGSSRVRNQHPMHGSTQKAARPSTLSIPVGRIGVGKAAVKLGALNSQHHLAALLCLSCR